MSTTDTRLVYVSPGVINVTDASGATTSLQFTSTGQIQSIKDPLNRVTQFTHDANDYLKQITAPGNKIYKFTYDAQGRLLSQTDPLNQSVSFTYGTNSDSPTTVTDQRGNKVTYSYDSSGSLTGITYANNKAETFIYNASGQLTQATEQSGDIFKYSYDSSGRLTKKTFDNGTYEQYTYNSEGNLATVRDVSGGNTQMVYDTQNRLTKITYPGGRFLQYTYDLEGRRTKMVDQNGFTTNYSYDAEGQLTGLTNGAGASIIAYSYDAVGRLTRETNGNGTYTTYNYDAAGQLLKITNYKENNTVNSAFEYTYDSLGRQTTAKTPDGTWTNTYDATGQLTRAQFASTNASITNQDLQYTYDAAGNRIKTVINGVTTNYSGNNLNQYVTVGTATYTYNSDGNLTKVVDGTKTWTYTYNDENRLIKAVTPNGTWDYKYNAFGDRTAVIKNGQRTDYLVDPFGLGDVVGEYNSTGVLVANYAHGLGLVGRFNGSNAAYYDSDLIGSTVGLTNASGSYVNRYAYRPFGENLITSEGVANPFEYVGQWGVMDDASGLDYMRARFYSPTSGRFLSPDPIGFAAGDANLYRYTFGNPTTLSDPSGKWVLVAAAGLTVVGTALWAGAVGLATYGGVAEPLKRRTEAQNRLLQDPFDQNAYDDYVQANRDLAQRGKPTSEFLGKAYGSPADAVAGMLADALQGLGNIGKQSSDSSSSSNRTSAPYAGDAAQNAGRGVFDPLVLDLDGDGIELVSIDQSTAKFDLNADGFREQTGWVKPDDGMLALDANGDGKINNITELFGDALTDGFDELKTLDSNNDKVINSSDTQFSQLKIWQDVDQDGITDAGELKTLGQLGIQSISLNVTETQVENEGNLIRTTSKYTQTNGVQRDVVALWFAADRLNTIYDQPYQFKPETLFLPTTRGYGQLPDLYISMSLDSQLLGLMRQFAGLTVQNLDQVTTKVEAVLFRWAGVDGVNPTSRGSYFDARKLGFLEKFLQQSLDFDFGSERQTLFVRQAWDTVNREISARLLTQGAMRNLFPDTTYSINSDSLETSSNLSTALNRLTANVPTGTESLARYWSYAILILDAHADRFNLTQTDYDNQIKTALTPSGLSAYLDVLRHPVYGTAGNDMLYSNEGLGSFLDGAAGDDTLIGSEQNDIINGGRGNDTITCGAGIDLVDGGAGIDTLTVADFSAATSPLSVNDTNNPLIALANGTQFKNVERFIDLKTGNGDDTITFTVRQNNTINTGAGNDTLNAGLGASDQVEGGAGNDLLILDYSVGDTGKGVYSYTSNDTEGAYGYGYRYTTNNTGLDYLYYRGINRFNITGTSKDDDFRGWNGSDTLAGGAGNDRLDGEGGNDIITGGAGDDAITSTSGNDTLDGGSGNDQLKLDLSAQTANLTITNPSTGISLASIVTATNFETFDITTGNGNDQITQAGLVAGAVIRGDDNLIGGAGNDTLNPGLGASDQVEGGAGNDLLILDYSVGDTGTRATFYAQADTEGAYGYGYRYTTDNTGLDYLYFRGINRFNTTGTSKDDDLRGWNGNDVLAGGAGNDTIEGGLGVDSLDGGAGSDQLELDLSTQTANLTINNPSAGISLPSIVTATNFETFDITSGSGNDQITQAGLVAGAVVRGDDTFMGGAGDDTLNAGLGDDDRVEGGDGDDLLILDYSVGDTGESMYLSTSNNTEGASGYGYRYTTNSADDVTFTGINRFNITGTSKDDDLDGWNGNDTLAGGAGNDRLDGEGGNDIITGGAGDDAITSTSGNDTLDGGSGNDQLKLDLSAQTANLTITNPSAGISLASIVTTSNFETFDITTGSGNDQITQAGLVAGVVVRGDDNLIGGAGNDTLNPGLGASDRVEGGDGDDLLILDYSVGDTGKGVYSYTSNDTEGAYGSGYRYTTDNTGLDYLYYRGINRFNITGTSKDDDLEGWNGSDTLAGGAGNDSLTGGSGNDKFLYNTNAAFSSAAVGVDAIADFAHNFDKFVLDKTTFTAITSAVGTGFSLAGEFATVGSNAAAATSSADIVYNSVNGSLFYNQNGTAAGLGTGAQFAMLVGNPTISATDFMIQA